MAKVVKNLSSKHKALDSNPSLNRRAEQVLLEAGGWCRGKGTEVVQIMYIHVSKCKYDTC
jgi:hypothetical protein